MPDAPDKPFDPAAIAREKEAERLSKPFLNHPTVTVREFLKADYLRQREIDAECEALAGGRERKTFKPADGPAYTVSIQRKTPR